MPEEKSMDPVVFMRSHIQEHFQSLMGAENPAGVEIASLIRMVANQYDALAEQHISHASLSGARWGIMLRILAEERLGHKEGITPTYLAQCQNVSKNTISSLLRGLEEQGMIQRALDDSDRRLFRIQLTESGRAFLRDTAPRRLEHLNHLVADLTPQDQQALIDLLTKLYHSIHGHNGLDDHPNQPDSVEVNTPIGG
jgi:DNA-binding MarR family transcriptional regulator